MTAVELNPSHAVWRLEGTRIIVFLAHCSFVSRHSLCFSRPVLLAVSPSFILLPFFCFPPFQYYFSSISSSLLFYFSLCLCFLLPVSFSWCLWLPPSPALYPSSLKKYKEFIAMEYIFRITLLSRITHFLSSKCDRNVKLTGRSCAYSIWICLSTFSILTKKCT